MHPLQIHNKIRYFRTRIILSPTREFPRPPCWYFWRPGIRKDESCISFNSDDVFVLLCSSVMGGAFRWSEPPSKEPFRLSDKGPITVYNSWYQAVFVLRQNLAVRIQGFVFLFSSSVQTQEFRWTEFFRPKLRNHFLVHPINTCLTRLTLLN
jgi:hypothetical protein